MRLNHLLSVAGTILKNNTQSVLLAGSLAGVVTTGVTSAYARPLYLDRLAAYADATGQAVADIPLLERFRATWKIWVPPLTAGAATAAFIIAATTVAKRKYAAALAAYTMTAEAFEQYRTAVTKRVGEEVETTIRKELPLSEEAQAVTLMSTTDKYVFYDAITGREFLANRNIVDAAINTVNYTLINESTCSLNMFYREIGLPPTEMGGLLGWTVGDPVSVRCRPILLPSGGAAIHMDLFPEPRERFDRLG